MSVDVHNHVMPQRVLDLLAGDSRYQVVLKDGYFESPNDVSSLRFLIDKAGPENVMIGTDASFQSAPRAPVQDVLDALGPGRLDQAEVILSGNARSWFGIG